MKKKYIYIYILFDNIKLYYILSFYNFHSFCLSCFNHIFVSASLINVFIGLLLIINFIMLLYSFFSGDRKN